MSLIFMDGFDNYLAAGTTMTSSNVPYQISGTSGTLTIQTMPILGGLGVRGARVGTNDTHSMYTNLPKTWVSGETIGVGAHYYADLRQAGIEQGIMALASSSGVFSIILLMTDTGKLEVRSGSFAGTLLGDSGSNVLDLNALYHIEMKVGLHASTGTVTVRVNGVDWITATAKNTISGTSISRLQLLHNAGATGGGGENHRHYMTDVFVWDGAGAQNNDFLGGCNVITLFPSADTADADWTKSTGVVGFSIIDNMPPTADYLEAPNVADLSIFDLTDLPHTSFSVKGVQAQVFAQKTIAGAVGLEFGIDSNNVLGLSAAIDLTQSQYLYKDHVRELNPDTGALFTPAEINALQVVLQRAS